MYNFLMYGTQRITEWFNVSRQTVANWSAEFESYLSPTARPEAGKKRIFNDDDLRVFALVHEYRNRGMEYADIHAALRAGQRGELPTRAIMAAPPAELINRLREEMDRMRDEREQLRRQIAEKDGQLQLMERLMKEQLEAKEQQIRELYREIARSEARGDRE